MLIKVKNISDRPLDLNGISVNPGAVKSVPRGGVVGYALARGKIVVIHENVTLHDMTTLENMKMGQLREIGRPLGVNDTDKSELIREILEKEDEMYG